MKQLYHWELFFKVKYQWVKSISSSNYLHIQALSNIDHYHYKRHLIFHYTTIHWYQMKTKEGKTVNIISLYMIKWYRYFMRITKVISDDVRYVHVSLMKLLTILPIHNPKQILLYLNHDMKNIFHCCTKRLFLWEFRTSYFNFVNSPEKPDTWTNNAIFDENIYYHDLKMMSEMWISPVLFSIVI